MTVEERAQTAWDLNVTIKSEQSITRVKSLNHPIAVQFASHKIANSIANVSLCPSINKKLVPCKDFILLFRDNAVEKFNPTALATKGQSGHQAIGLSILPDFNRAKHSGESRAKPNVDLDPQNVYVE